MRDSSIGDDLPEVLEKYQIKALPTRYNGIEYRSRIEARWAIFFDALRIKHEYEREGFDLGDGIQYLPDFWLPQQDCWVEIKGAEPDEDACDKAYSLSAGTGKEVFVFFGAHEARTGIYGTTIEAGAYKFFPEGASDATYRWCECTQCGRFGIEFQGRSDRLPCKERDGKAGCRRSVHGDKGHAADTRRLLEAYNAARSMRFTR